MGNSGGFIPYTSMTRRSQSIGSTVLSNNASVVHVAETSHWLTRNEVGDPAKTAWMINDKGNKVWFKYEHTPSLFPVKETRFYKPSCTRLISWARRKMKTMREPCKL